MTLDLDALEALEKKATPGPWKATPFRLKFSDGEGPLMGYLAGSNTTPEGLTVSLGSEREADHHFVAALRNALPELIRLARIGQKAERDAKENA